VLPGLFLFAIALVLLCTDWRGRDNHVAAMENRNPAAWPGAPRSLGELATWPERFGLFFADHFGLRPELVAIRARLGERLLKKSISPLVVFGSQGWQFYAGNRSLENHLHEIPFSAADLDEWAARLKAREAWFAARGIAYLYDDAPDKASIYPEYMPPALVPGSGQTRLDQLDQRLSGDPGLLDLRSALLAGKPAGQLYFKADTHWNDLGAYVGYRAIMRRLGLPPLERDPRRLVPIRVRVDIARISAVARTEPTTLYRRRCTAARPSGFDPAVFDRQRRNRQPAYTIPGTVCPTGHGRLLIFHDSFATGLAPYLSDTFARVVYVWRTPSFAAMQAMAAAEHPSVVIEERVERFLPQPLAP
jgi:alginate O-acetyltransferase complex protein AlgJ